MGIIISVISGFAAFTCLGRGMNLYDQALIAVSPTLQAVQDLRFIEALISLLCVGVGLLVHRFTDDPVKRAITGLLLPADDEVS